MIQIQFRIFMAIRTAKATKIVAGISRVPFCNVVADRCLNTAQKVQDYIKGKEFIVIGNSGRHNYGCAGTRFKPSCVVSCSTLNGTNLIPGGNSIQWTEVSLVEVDNKTSIVERIGENKKNIEALRDENALLEEKLAFMEENKLTEFSEEEFRVYRTLELVESKKLTKLQKAQAIAGLFK